MQDKLFEPHALAPSSILLLLCGLASFDATHLLLQCALFGPLSLSRVSWADRQAGREADRQLSKNVRFSWFPKVRGGEPG